jgi:hypothetical protein
LDCFEHLACFLSIAAQWLGAYNVLFVPGGDKRGFQMDIIRQSDNYQINIRTGSQGIHVICGLRDIPTRGERCCFVLIATIDDSDLLIGYLGEPLHVECG